MANDASGFYETLLSAIEKFNASVMGQVALLGNVYVDVKPEIARIGHQINIPYPDLGGFADQGVSDWTTTDVNSSNYKSVTFTARPGKAILIRDFEQYQTAENLIDQYVRPMYQRAREYLNGVIAGMITSTNFAAFAPIVGQTQGEVTVTDTLSAWDNLAAAKVPMDNEDDLALLVHPSVYRKMLGDAQYNQESIVSAMIAQEARQTGKVANTFRFRPQWDQQMPSSSAYVLHGDVVVTNGSTTVTGYATSFTQDLTTSSYLVFGNDSTKTRYSVSAITSDTALTLGSSYGGSTATTKAKRVVQLAGTVGATNASTAVTGSGTGFTTALVVGDWLIFSNDTTRTPYQVASITSDTALVLTSNYAGATATGLTAQMMSFTAIAMHRYAIGVALRNLPSPEMNGLPFPGKWSYVDLGGIPARLMMSYQHLKSGALMSVDFGYGASVLRPSFGQIIQV